MNSADHIFFLWQEYLPEISTYTPPPLIFSNLGGEGGGVISSFFQIYSLLLFSVTFCYLFAYRAAAAQTKNVRCCVALFSQFLRYENDDIVKR